MEPNTDLGAVHPVADLFPMMTDEELHELAEDIRENGLLHPLVLDPEGTLLDGRNRLAACRMAGVTPTTVVYGGDATSYIISANVQRRHLSKGQCAMATVAAQLFTPGKFQAKSATAKALGLSGALLSKAITVKEHAPELVDQVLAGDASLNDAYVVAQRRKNPSDVFPALLSASSALREGLASYLMQTNIDVVLEYIEQHRDDPEVQRWVQRELDDLEKARALLRQYIDALCAVTDHQRPGCQCLNTSRRHGEDE